MERCCLEMVAGRRHRERGRKRRQGNAPLWFSRKNFSVDAFPSTAVIYQHRYPLNAIQQAQNTVEFYKATVITSMICALYDFRIFSFDILMDVNDGSV